MSGTVEIGRTRDERISARVRNPKWKLPPVYIDMSICINCDACLRACPDKFGAIFNHGADVIVIPELCSGCDKCLPVCPVDCIFDIDGEFVVSGDEWWQLAVAGDDAPR